MFSSVSHVLPCLKFEKLFDLGFRDLWVGPKVVGKFVVDFFIMCPFANIGKSSTLYNRWYL